MLSVKRTLRVGVKYNRLNETQYQYYPHPYTVRKFQKFLRALFYFMLTQILHGFLSIKIPLKNDKQINHNIQGSSRRRQRVKINPAHFFVNKVCRNHLLKLTGLNTNEFERP